MCTNTVVLYSKIRAAKRQTKSSSSSSKALGKVLLKVCSYLMTDSQPFAASFIAIVKKIKIKKKWGWELVKEEGEERWHLHVNRFHRPPFHQEVGADPTPPPTPGVMKQICHSSWWWAQLCVHCLCSRPQMSRHMSATFLVIGECVSRILALFYITPMSCHSCQINGICRFVEAMTLSCGVRFVLI